MIGIIDYRAGNVGSIQNIIKYVGGNSFISSDIQELSRADKLILPGVGSFDYGVEQLRKYNLDKFIIESASKKGVPLLGICLGMQLLGKSSDEGRLEGLGLFDAKIKKFNIEDKKYKIPHMGWNSVEITKKNKLLSQSKFYKFYFVHSFFFEPQIDEIRFGVTNYYKNFTSFAHSENIYGVQFHPEKSHKYGMELFKNFLKLK